MKYGLLFQQGNGLGWGLLFRAEVQGWDLFWSIADAKKGQKRRPKNRTFSYFMVIMTTTVL